jgi:heterotetrameric sarcosine oxidase gamma subunit
MAAPEFDAGPVAVRRIEPLAVVALRHLPGAGDDLVAALRAAGVPVAPAPGHVVGQGPWALWRSPSEVLLLATERATSEAALAALTPATLACAVDQSDGTLALELQGPLVDDLLRRLIDSGSLPGVSGSAVRARLADIAVVLVRRQAKDVWLLADRSHEHYLASWLAHAGAAMAKGPAAQP